MKKELIKYLELRINNCDKYVEEISKKVSELQGRSVGRTYLANEIMKNAVAKNVYKEILEVVLNGTDTKNN